MKTDKYMKSVSIKTLSIGVIILTLTFSGCQTFRNSSNRNESSPSIPEAEIAPIESIPQDAGVPIIPSGTGSVPGGSVTGQVPGDAVVPVSQPDSASEPQTGQQTPVNDATTSIEPGSRQGISSNISLVSGTEEYPKRTNEAETGEVQKPAVNTLQIITPQKDSFNTDMDQYSSRDKVSSETTVNVSQSNPDSAIVPETNEDGAALNPDQLDENKDSDPKNEESSSNENLSTENQRIYRYQLAESTKYSSDFRSDNNAHFVQRTVSKAPIHSLLNNQQNKPSNSLIPIAPVSIPFSIQNSQNELSGQFSSRTDRSSVRTVVVP